MVAPVNEVVKGDKRELAILIMCAFRYASNRHQTQIMKNIENLIIDHMHLLCDDFVHQMIEDISFEKEIERVRKEKGTDYSFTESTEYLDRLLNCLQQEYERRRNEVEQ